MADKLKLVIASMLVLAVFVSSGCINIEYEGPKGEITKQETDEVPETIVQEDMYEITETDVFSMMDVINSTNIMVMGIKLGDPIDDVLTGIGTPDIQAQVGPDSFNLEYRERLMAEHTALLFHTDNGTVTRITFRPEFNRYLKGDTVLQNKTKTDMYAMFGKPDKIQLTSYFTIYYFYEKGLEIVLDGKFMEGFSIVPPKPSIRDEKVIVS